MNETIDLSVCCRTFVKRKLDNRDKERIDNGSLYAGSPMYYYCKGCDDHIATLSESHRNAAPSLCESCAVLKKNGLLQELLKLIKGNANTIKVKVEKFISEMIVDA